MEPIFTVVEPSGGQYKVYYDGHIEGFAENSCVANGALTLINFLRSLAEEAVDSGIGGVSSEDFSNFISQWGIT